MVLLDPVERIVRPSQKLDATVQRRAGEQLRQRGQDELILANQEGTRRVVREGTIDHARNDKHNRNL